MRQRQRQWQPAAYAKGGHQLGSPTLPYMARHTSTHGAYLLPSIALKHMNRKPEVFETCIPLGRPSEGGMRFIRSQL